MNGSPLSRQWLVGQPGRWRTHWPDGIAAPTRRRSAGTASSAVRLVRSGPPLRVSPGGTASGGSISTTASSANLGTTNRASSAQAPSRSRVVPIRSEASFSRASRSRSASSSRSHPGSTGLPGSGRADPAGRTGSPGSSESPGSSDSPKTPASSNRTAASCA
ncbi:hypothetical protein GXW82_17615 [Streptacidiphilus sp. 4-A2]|nr:hypothetical protein [Streptacidiphilus sp. 4-A2]